MIRHSLRRSIGTVLVCLAGVAVLAPAGVAKARKRSGGLADGTQAQQPFPGEGAAMALDTLQDLVETPALSGYERGLVQKIRSRLAQLHPAADRLGDVTITIGSGSPRRLIVTPLDEPGFVVSQITPEGYLRVQRLPQLGLPPIYNELYAAQPVSVQTSSGRQVPGVVAALSIHLQPGRIVTPRADDLDNFYVDIGATSASEARAAGVDILDPILLDRRLLQLGFGRAAGTATGDRFGAAAVLSALANLDRSRLQGTLTVAFVVQQRTGARGLQRILQEFPADEMIYVGRLLPGGLVPGATSIRRAPRSEPGSGVLLGLPNTNGALDGFPASLKQLADENRIPFAVDYSADLIPRSYLPAPPFPARWAHLAIATAWPDTPAELIDAADLANLVRLLLAYAGTSSRPLIYGQAVSGNGMGPQAGCSESRPSDAALLAALTETYAVSEHEEPMRARVKSLLPCWAKPQADAGGNLILSLGSAPRSEKNPSIVVVAHMDEIGMVVQSISSDGRLAVSGDEAPDLFAGRPALVHSANGDHAAIFELPSGWDAPNFQWPSPRESRNAFVDVGARTAEEAAQLGIRAGDTVTFPKHFQRLLGSRITVRSLDDRVGCTALISAVWALGGPLEDRNVTFVWSTREELGLYGAAEVAKALADQGKAPDYVFAVDTFVSSDSPLESPRFADATVGKGFVVRAVDNSNIVRQDLAARVVAMARAAGIPAQYGVTGGGNDGSAFVRYGSVDVALGWALRYSHSPAELADMRDVSGLGRIITLIARNWSDSR